MTENLSREVVERALRVLERNAARLPSGNHADENFNPIDSPAVAQEKAIAVVRQALRYGAAIN